MIVIRIRGCVERTVAENALDAAAGLVDGGATRLTAARELLVEDDDAAELVQIFEHAASYYRKTRLGPQRRAAEQRAGRLADAAAARRDDILSKGPGPGDWRDAD